MKRNDEWEQWERDLHQDIDPTRDNPEDDYARDDMLSMTRALIVGGGIFLALSAVYAFIQWLLS